MKKHYRHKQALIHAEQVTELNIRRLVALHPGWKLEVFADGELSIGNKTGYDEYVDVFNGDYVLTLNDGTVDWMSKVMFENQYEPYLEMDVVKSMIAGE
jgi:hypothetical protein